MLAEWWKEAGVIFTRSLLHTVQTHSEVVRDDCIQDDEDEKLYKTFQKEQKKSLRQQRNVRLAMPKAIEQHTSSRSAPPL